MAPLPPGRYRAGGVIPAFAEELRSLVIEFEVESEESNGRVE